MRKHATMVLVAMLGGLMGLGMGCSDSDSDGGGGVQVRPANDGQYAGFLWKPKSESNGNLVVLLPTQLRGRVSSANLHTANSTSQDTLIEVGRFVGDTHNGNRPHFRFLESGGTYGSVWVIAETEEGTLGWEIPNGAQRWD